MTATATKTDPQLWEEVKDKITDEDKGGKPGQWSARKAQMATQEYKKQGGEYEGDKSKDNHLQQWTDEKWGTRSGEKSEDTGERYLPEKARDSLTEDEYKRSSNKKKQDSKKGKQFSKQPEDVATKTAKARKHGLGDLTKGELMKRAAAKEVRNRSKMNKSELVESLEESEDMEVDGEGDGSEEEDEDEQVEDEEDNDDENESAEPDNDEAKDDELAKDDSAEAEPKAEPETGADEIEVEDGVVEEGNAADNDKVLDDKQIAKEEKLEAEEEEELEQEMEQEMAEEDDEE